MKKMVLAIAAVVSGSLLAATLEVTSNMTLTEGDSLAGYDAIHVAEGATLTFNISAGETLVVPCPLNGRGSVVKNGAGEVDYTYVNTAKAVYTDYYIESPGATTINDGTLKLPTYTPDYYWSGNRVGRFTVNAPGKLDIGANSQTCIYGLWGDGEVTTTDTGNYDQLDVQADKSNAPSKFYGLVSGKIRQRSSNGQSDFMSTDNTNNGEMALGANGSVGITKFGNHNGTGSLGTSAITMRGNNSAIRYLGSGETATRTFIIGSGANQLEIDAGATGNLVLSGDLSANNSGAANFILSGGNSGACEYSGKMRLGNSTSLALVKKGSGTWKISNPNNAIDSVRIEAGRLEIASGAVPANTPIEVTGAGKLLLDDSAANAGDTLLTFSASSTLTAADIVVTRSNSGYRAEIVTDGDVKKAVLRYDAGSDFSEYASYIQLTRNDPQAAASTETKNDYSYCYAGGWSDGLWPTSDKDYFVPAGITMTLPHGQVPNNDCHHDHGVSGASAYWTNLKFYGRKLAVAGALVSWGDAANLNGYPLVISDLTMLPGSSFTAASQNGHVIGKFGTGCKMTVKSNAANPFTIRGVQQNTNWYIIRSDLYGDEDAAIALVNENPSGSKKNNVSFDGSASAYKGLVTVGANEVLNITNSVFGGRIKLEGGEVKIDVSKFAPAGYGSRVFAFVTDSAAIPANVTVSGTPAAGELEYRYNEAEGLYEAWMTVDRIPTVGDYGAYLRDNGFVYKTVDEKAQDNSGATYPLIEDNQGSGKRFSSYIRPDLWKRGTSYIGDEFIDGDYVTTARVFFNDYDYGEFPGNSLTFLTSGSTFRADWWTTVYCRDMRFQAGAYIFNAGGGNKTITIGGRLTIIGTSEFRSSANPNSEDVLRVDAKFCGDGDAVFNVTRGAVDRTGTKTLRFTGDCSEYYGTLNIDNEGVLDLGNAGFPEASVVIAAGGLGLKTTGGSAISVKNLTIAGGQTISLNGKGFNVTGTFTKTGSGAVALNLIGADVEPGEKAVFTIPAGASASDFTVGLLPYGWTSEFRDGALYVTVPEPTSAKRIAVLGDSITHGGHWPYFLQMLDAMRNPGSGDVYLNCGISGDTTGGALNRLNDDVIARNPDTVIMMFGMNDVGRGYYVAEPTQKQITDREYVMNTTFPNNMNQLVNRLTTAGKKIILATPTPYDQYGDYEGAQENYPTCNSIGLAGIAAKVRAIAEANELDLIDFHAPMTEVYESLTDVTVKAQRFNRVDRVHPEIVGHALMSVIAWNELGNTDPYSDQTFVASGSTFSTTYTPGGLPLPDNTEYNRARQVVPELYNAINREIVKITGLSAGSYDLKAGSTVLGNFTAEELAAGVNLANLAIPGKATAILAYSKALAIQAKGSLMRGVVMMEIQAKKNNPSIDLTDFDAVSANLDTWVAGLTSNQTYYQNLVNSYKSNGSQAKQAEIYGQIDTLTAELKALAIPASYTLSVEQTAVPKAGATILFR